MIHAHADLNWFVICKTVRFSHCLINLDLLIVLTPQHKMQHLRFVGLSVVIRTHFLLLGELEKESLVVNEATDSPAQTESGETPVLGASNFLARQESPGGHWDETLIKLINEYTTKCMYTTTSRFRFAYIHLHIKRCQIQYFDEQQRTIVDFNYFTRTHLSLNPVKYRY